MKHYTWLLTLLLAVALAGLTGCSKKDEVNTAKLEQSFQSAEPAAKSGVDKAVTAVKNADYATALAELQRVAGQVKLTPEQQQAVKDVIGQVQNKLVEAGKQATEGAQKAIGDLQKSLPK